MVTVTNGQKSSAPHHGVPLLCISRGALPWRLAQLSKRRRWLLAKPVLLAPTFETELAAKTAQVDDALKKAYCSSQ
eukprot:280645-Amphidinium_carterae.1